MRQIPIPKLDARAQLKFWLRTQVVESGCIEWQGATASGYGRVRLGEKFYGAHRVALSLHLRRDLVREMVVDHLCRNPRCVNPDHLEEASYLLNTMRGTSPSASLMRALSETGRCSRGHDGGEIRLDNKGTRRCRACARENEQSRWAKRPDSDRERRRLYAIERRKRLTNELPQDKGVEQ